MWWCPRAPARGMIKAHYPRAARRTTPTGAAAEALAARTSRAHLVPGRRAEGRPGSARYAGSVTYHDSCSGLRELGVKAQPRQLLAQVEGLELVELADAEVCCGFGGTFCVKYPDISNAIVERQDDDDRRHRRRHCCSPAISAA